MAVTKLPQGFYGAIADGAGAHNSIYRGKNLGSSVTSEQWSAISNGTFKDLYIGDYWTINNVNWRIADFDYWYGAGDTACTTHHVVIVPDKSLHSSRMDVTSTTTGAYLGSEMYTTNLSESKTIINNAFGSSHILSKRLHLSNAASNGVVSGGAWRDSTVDLMNEINVYGCRIFDNAINGTTAPHLHTVDHSQFALFAHEHKRISTRGAWWLRDVYSATAFCSVFTSGSASFDDAAGVYGVRPAFGICG